MNKPTHGARILIAEDEPKIAKLLIDYLSRDGFDAHWINDGAKVLPTFETNGADLILLDIMMPGRDGIENCRAIRAISDVPIVMVTARVEEVDRLLGLNLGADDYICKPFSPREVVARVRTILRRIGRTAHESSNSLFKVNEDRMQITLDEQALSLTGAEFKMLVAMINRPGTVFSRDHLLDIIGDEPSNASDRAIDSHVKNLRKKLAQVRPDTKLIASVYGAGYKLDDTIEQ